MIGKLVSLMLVFVMAVGPALAAPVPKKKKPDPRDVRIEQLEKQVQEQSRALQEMRREIDALKTAQPVVQETPAPAETPTPAETPVAAESPAPGDDVIIDESVPPSATTPVPGATPAPTPGSQPQGTATRSFFNPAISVIGLFEARTSSDKASRFDNQISVREVELALQAPIDPFATYEVFLALPNDGGIEVEEAFATFLKLPLDTQAKMGKFKASMGRNNRLHAHELPQIDRPRVIEEFFGEEGLAGPGISTSTLFPTSWYSDLTLQAITNDNETLFSGGVSQTPIYLASWRNLFDLREDLTLDVGVSGAWGKGNGMDVLDTTVGGASLTMKYRPLRRIGQFGVTWESEYFTETQRVPITVEPAAPDAEPTMRVGRRAATGLYSYVQVEATQNWFFGLRYDYAHKPINPDEVIKGLTGWLGYRFSEFNSLRLQYSSYDRTLEGPLQQWFLQWNVSIGPHGAHKY